MDTSNFTTRRPPKGGLSLQEKAREWSRGKPTLEQEAARLAGLKAKAAEAAADHTCPKCGERYFSAYANGPHKPAVIMCGCNKPLPPEQEYERLYKRSGLKTRARWDGILHTEARALGLAHCRELLANGGGWLTMYGDYGGGKSHLAAATCNEFMISGKSAMMILFDNFLDSMRLAFRDDSQEDAGELFERAQTVDLLVVDELDVFKPTEWAIQRLSTLYRRRYVNRGCLATIWLTNRQPVSSAIQPGYEWLGPLYSRIAEGAVVHMLDKDIRPTLGAARTPPPPENW